MGFDKHDTAKPYTPQDADTLHAIAERETAQGNPLTWQDIARYNWGTDDEATANEFLRDELGAYQRDADNNFIISTDVEPRSELLIPVRFKQSGLALKQIHTLRVIRKVAPPQFLTCCQIPGTTFAYDKSFLRPSVVDHLQPLEDELAAHPEAMTMIFGHTDKVGNEHYNKTLSERRALSTYAFITNDAETWEMLYNQEMWGTKVIQEILKDFDEPAFDPGPADGIYGSQTRQAVRNYQEARGLYADGNAGPETRKALFYDYMTGKHDIELTPDQFMDPKHMGCGEFNPVEETEMANEDNRRVTFFLFHPDRLPNLPCQHGSLAPCHKQSTPPWPRYTESFKCSFYDSIAKKCGCETVLSVFRIRLFDRLGYPLPEAPFVATIEQAEQQGTANEQGFAVLRDVKVPGTCIIRWNRPETDEEATEESVEVSPAFEFELEVFIEIEESASEEVVRQRLHNLGYSFGDTLDENIRAFQRDYDLPETGNAADPQMQLKLREVHDSCNPDPYKPSDPPIQSLFDDE
ncbi:MAG: peptidoglycan-binding protein [Rhodothermales bacterium]